MSGYSNGSESAVNNSDGYSSSGSLGNGGGRAVYSNSVITITQNNFDDANIEDINLDGEYTDGNYYDKSFLDVYFLRYGDFNNDGFVDNKDVTDLQKKLGNDDGSNYDLNGDGNFTVADVTLLQNYIAGEQISSTMLKYNNNENITNLIYENNESITADDIKGVLSNLSPQEYEEYVIELEEQYDVSIAECKEYKKQLESIYGEAMKELSDAMQNDYSDVIGIKFGTPEYDNNKVLSSIGITRSEAKRLYKSMQAEIDSVDYKIAQIETEKQKCKYYGIIYAKDYIDYKPEITPREKDDFIKYSSGRESHDSTSSFMDVEFDYNSYVEKCKKEGLSYMNPLQYYECYMKVEEIGERSSKTIQVDHYDVISSIYALKDKVPDYYKTYCYYYDQDPKLAEEYLDSMTDEILNVHGQYMAAEGLSSFDEKDGNDDELGEIANNLNVSTSGLVMGVEQFIEGGVYSFEALAATFGYDGTTQMSAYEYASLYELYGLMSQENKEKMGLIRKNEETGEYENTDSESIIDFTKEYTGNFLDRKLQISQGLGSSIPAVALSFIHPMVGTVAVGMSSGGNAYHGAMIQGHEKYESILYGAVTGVSSAFLERKIGGLTGLSNTQIKSLKTYLVSIGKETAMGQFSGLMDDLYRASYLGEGFPETEEGWAQYFEEKKWLAIQSAVTSSVINAPALGTSIYKRRSFNSEAAKFGLSDTEQNAIIDKYREKNPAAKNMSNDDIILQYNKEIKSLMRGEYLAAKTSSYRDSYHDFDDSMYYEKICGTDLDKRSAFDVQIAAYQAEHGSYETISGTNIPKDLVISDLNYISAMGDGDYSLGLSRISNEFGSDSIQYASALSTVFNSQVSSSLTINGKTKADTYVGISEHIQSFYKNAGINAVDYTTVAHDAGMDISDARGITRALEQFFTDDTNIIQRMSSALRKGIDTLTGPNSAQARNGIRDGNIPQFYQDGVQLMADQMDTSNPNHIFQGMQQDTLLYKALGDMDWVGQGQFKGLSGQELVDAINSSANGTLVFNDDSFQSTTAILGQGYTDNDDFPIIEVTSCPKGTEGAYIGTSGGTAAHYAEYLLQAGSGNNTVILGAELINGKVYVYTQMVGTQ